MGGAASRANGIGRRSEHEPLWLLAVSAGVIAVAGALHLLDSLGALEAVAAALLLAGIHARLAVYAIRAGRRSREASWATSHAQRLAGEQRALAGATRAVSSSLELDQVFSTVVEELAHLLDVSDTALVELDRESRGIVRAAPATPERQGATVPADQGLLEMVLRHDGTIVLDCEGWRRLAPEWAGSGTVVAVLATPVRSQGRTRAVLLAVRERGASFVTAEIRMAEAFAECAGLAIGNAELLAAERGQIDLYERRAREQVALIAAAKSINSSQPFEVVASRIVALAAELARASRFSLWMARDGGEVEIVLANRYRSLEPGDRLPHHAGLAGRVIDSGRPLLCEESQWRKILELSGLNGDDVAASAVALPIRWKDRVRGVVEFGFDRPGKAREDEVRVLEAFVELVGLAFGNAEILAAEQRRREQSEDRLRETAALVTAAKSITTTLDQEEVTRRIVEQMRELLGADRAGLNLVEPDGTVTILVPVDGDRRLAGHRMPAGEGLSGHVLAKDGTVVVNDWRWDELPTAGSHQKELLNLSSAIAAPVRVRGTVRAVLLAGYGGKGPGIDADKVRVVEGFAELAAIALDNASAISRADRAPAEAEDLPEAASEPGEAESADHLLARLVEP